MAEEISGDFFDLQEEMRQAYERWLETESCPMGMSLFSLPQHGANGREIEYDEWIEAVPKNLTSEDLTANHAAGLPLIRERIIRCKDCRWFTEFETPSDEEYPHFCIYHGTDLTELDKVAGFCAWAEYREKE